jgi:uncharacterized membrane protein
MNPWDIHALLTAKHAQHVVLIHFPIALFLAGVGFDLVATITRRREWALAACYNLIFAAVSAVPAALTGLLAWQWELEGRRLKGILLLHLLFGASSALLVLVVAWIHTRSHRRHDGLLPALRWPLQALAVVLVILTGHLGGFLSGVNHP